jgi:hypothetical protein
LNDNRLMSGSAACQGRCARGWGGAPGYHDGARGQEAGATGYNNSHTDCQDN